MTKVHFNPASPNPSRMETTRRANRALEVLKHSLAILLMCLCFLPVWVTADVVSTPRRSFEFSQSGERVSSLAVSPVTDHFLVGAHAANPHSACTALLLRDIYTGQTEVAHVPSQSPGRPARSVPVVAFTPDGHRCLAAAAFDDPHGPGGNLMMSVVLGDLASGEIVWRLERHSILNPFQHNVSVAFSLDGTEVLTGDELAARFWNSDTGALVREFQLQDLAAARNPFPMVALSPRGTEVFVHQPESTAVVDAFTGRKVQELPRARSGTFTPDGQSLLAEFANGEWTAEP